MKRITSLAAALIFNCSCSFAQDKPILNQQIPLDNISNVVSAPGRNSFLASNEGGSYTFLDQYSKLQLGTLQLDIGDMAVPGHGATWLRNDHSFVVNDGSSLLSADIISKKTDTVLTGIKFPEFIIGFQPLLSDTSKLLVIVKKFPVDNKGLVHFLVNDGKGLMLEDDSRNCRLLIYDTKNRNTLRSVQLDFMPVVMLQTAKEIFIGTMDGDIKKLDADYKATQLIHAFDKPLHSMLLTSNYLVLVPQKEKRYLNAYGGDQVLFYNLSTGAKKQISLVRETPYIENEFGMNPAPHASVKNLFALPGQEGILVSYGFTRLMKIGLPGFDTMHYSIPFHSVDFYAFNRDSTQLLMSASENAGVFKTSGNLMMYDLQRKQVTSTFRRSSPIEKFKNYYRFFDRQGNYHIIALRAELGNRDSLIIFSSNRTNPCIIDGPDDAFLLNEKDTTLGITTSSGFVYGKFRLENLFAGYYRFNISYGYNSEDSYPQSIFDMMIDSRKLATGIKFPFSIISIQSIPGDKYVITGLTPAKPNNQLVVLVMDRQGQQLFRTADMSYNSFDATEISPSGKLIAVNYGALDKVQLDCWDWQAKKKAFAKSFSNRERLHHYCFDRTKEIFWFSSTSGQGPIEVFKWDPGQTGVAAVKAFVDETAISFRTDIENDRIASEGYNVLKLHRLSDHALLWEHYPFSSYFKVSQYPDGFGWSSEKEWHYMNRNNDHIYFTSFVPFRPLQVLNDRLYQGERSAANNMAFVFRQKAYLPSEFDIYFNRPDSIIELGGSANTAFNQLLRKVVEKRKNYQQNFSLEDLMNRAPTLEIADKNKVQDDTRQKSISLNLNITERNADPVQIISVKDNGVEFRLPATGSNVEIPLVNGPNRLEVSALSKAGYKSSPDYITVNASFEAAEPKIYFIGVGVSDYADKNMNLQYADKDIRDLAGEFAKRFPNAIIDTFINSSAKASSIRGIKEKLKNCLPQDKVLLGFSGHGLVDKNGNFFFATYDMDFQQPAKAGLSYTDIEDILSGIPSRNRLLWIDACHSGELDKNFKTDSAGMNNNVKAYPGNKGGITTATESAVTLQNSFELMKELFSNFSNNDGTVVISAAGGLEFALEDEKWQNGVFTYAFKKGFVEKLADENKDGHVSVNELKQYISRSVEELTGGRQKPTSRKESLEFDWNLD